MKILLLLLSISLYGCGEKNESKGTVVAPQNQSHIITMSSSALAIRPGAVLPNSLAQIHDELRRNGQIEQYKVLRAQIDAEAAAYEYRTGQNINEAGIYGNLMTIASMVPAQTGIDGLKNSYLNILRAKNNKQVQLSFGSSTLIDPVAESRIDSLSGSKLFDFIMRAKNLNRGKNMVMIFQNGHVTPGFMIRPNQFQSQGGNVYTPQWNLIGIETTREGVGFLHFGDPNSFNGSPLQIIDADEFLMVELFKNYLQNPVRAVRQALRRTCRKYSISCANFPSMRNDYFFTRLNPSGYYNFNYTCSLNSIFAFGTFTRTYSIGWSSFSHRHVSGARYVNNRYFTFGVFP